MNIRFADRIAHSPLADGMLLSSVRAAQIAAEPMTESLAPAPRPGCPSSRHHEFPDALATVRQAIVDDRYAAFEVAKFVDIRQAASETPAQFVKRIALALIDEMGGGE